MGLSRAGLMPLNARPSFQLGGTSGLSNGAVSLHQTQGWMMPKSRIARLRDNAAKSQQGRCFYCGFEMMSSHSAALRFRCTAEHLIAKSDGGQDTEDNVVAACRFCNQKRHERSEPMDPKAFRAHVQKRLASGRWHPVHNQSKHCPACAEGSAIHRA
jgi:hypothetical protein